MARTNHIYNSFIGGEISPKFFGRTDTQQYNSCCEELFNCIVYPQGGAGRRTGTRVVGKFAYSALEGFTDIRMIPFYGTDGTRWQLILTDHKPDPIAGEYFWKAINVETKAYETIKYMQDETSGGNPILNDYYCLGALDTELVLPGLDIDLSELQYAQSGDTIIITHGDMMPIKITYNSAGATDSKFKMVSAIDPRNDTGSGTEGVLLSGYRTFEKTPFLLFTDSDLTVTVAASVATVVVAAGSKRFTQDNLRSYMRFTAAGNTLVIWVNVFDSTTQVRGRVVDGTITSSPTTFGDGGASDSSWEESAWSDERGWPKSVTFFESRLVFGGTRTNADSQWFSQTNDIERFSVRKLAQDADFADPVVATDPFEVTLRSNYLNEIRWMVSGKTVATGTNSSEFIVQGPDQSLSIGPSNIQTNQETPYGSAYIQAIRSDNTTLFVCRDRKTFRELVFNFNEDSFEANNLSLMAEHMIRRSLENRPDDDYLQHRPGGIKAFAKQQTPHGIIWALDTNGSLIGITRERKQNVLAWHYHELAGEQAAQFLGFDFTHKPSIATLSSIQLPLQTPVVGTPLAYGGEPDEVWMVVMRAEKTDVAGMYNNSAYIEYMAQEWEYPTIGDNWKVVAEPKNAPIYMDMAFIAASTDSSYDDDGTIDGHPYCRGQVLDVILNGAYMGQTTVSDDSSKILDISEFLTADQIAGDDDWQVVVGINFLAHLVPVVPEVPANTGSAEGQIRRIDQIVIHFYRTIGCRFGRKTSAYEENTPVASLEEVAFPPAENTGDPIPMFTGEKKLDFPQGYERRPQVYIESHLPFPFIVTHIVARMVVYEG